jgi:hypothetical protein
MAINPRARTYPEEQPRIKGATGNAPVLTVFKKKIGSRIGDLSAKPLFPGWKSAIRGKRK